MAPGHSYVEEQVEWDGYDVDPEHRQRHPVSHVPVIEVYRIQEGGEGGGHEAHDVEVSESFVEERVTEPLLYPQHDVTLYGIHIGSHIDLGVGHQGPVHAIQQILPEIDREDHNHMRPVAPEHVDETVKTEFRILRLEQRHHRYAEYDCTCDPGDVDASARCHVLSFSGRERAIKSTPLREAPSSNANLRSGALFEGGQNVVHY